MKKIEMLKLNYKYIYSFVTIFTTSLFLIAGFITSFVGFIVTANKIGYFLLLINIFLLIPAFGLYSLWWLLLNHRKVTIADIPRKIKIGLLIGTVTYLILFFPYVINQFVSIFKGEFLLRRLILIFVYSSPILSLWLLVNETKKNYAKTL